jgi:hypothetical protein
MIGEFSFDMDVTGEPLAAVRLPQGARLQNGHVRLQHGDWRPRGTLAVDLIDDAAPAAARAWIPSYTPRGDRRVMRVEVALPATPSSGTDFAVVLDDSAATGAGSLDIARAAVDALLRQLGAQDRVALLFGDLGARPAEGDLGRLGAVTAARRERVLDAVARVRPGGASDLGRMLSDAHAALDPRRNGVVIYLGDGSPTVGLIDPTRLAESLRRACPDLRLLGLAIGQGAHDDVLRALAGAGAVHTPALQVRPPVQAFPQAPQLALSVCRLRHASVQRVWPVAQPPKESARLNAPRAVLPKPSTYTAWSAAPALSVPLARERAPQVELVSSLQTGPVRLVLRCSTTVSQVAPPQVEAVKGAAVKPGQVPNQ